MLFRIVLALTLLAAPGLAWSQGGPPTKPSLGAAPTRSAADLERDQRFRAYLVGTWRLEVRAADVTTTMRYDPDGSYAGTSTRGSGAPDIDGRPVPPEIVDLSGTWTVLAKDDQRFVLAVDDARLGHIENDLRMLSDRTLLNETAGQKAYRIAE